MEECAWLVLHSHAVFLQGVFESKIMDVCEVLIAVTLLITAVILFVQIYYRGEDTEDVLLMVGSPLSLITLLILLPLFITIPCLGECVCEWREGVSLQQL